LKASCAADSLVIDGVMNADRLDDSVLSDKDQRQILETIRKEILHSEQHPRVELEAEIEQRSPTSFSLRGTLRLRGRERPVAMEAVRNGDLIQTSFELTPSEFGIPPYKALAGAIKLQDRVRVSIDVTLEGETPEVLIEKARSRQL
jgi:polyisoprenoid-binding protein YceI